MQKQTQVVAAGTIIAAYRSTLAPDSKVLFERGDPHHGPHVDRKLLQRYIRSLDDIERFPDAIVYRSQARSLDLVDIVGLRGPISTKRKSELLMLVKHPRGKIRLTSAFIDFKEFQKRGTTLAWGTVAWIAEVPDHTIILD